VFADDLSMGGAAASGDSLERAQSTLAAGCDVLPVCNDRAAVTTLLDRLAVDPEPASQLRIVRMRGRDGMPRAALTATTEWKESQELLARCSEAPALRLTPGTA
jgi:beta-N-acetylhexosaminidase